MLCNAIGLASGTWKGLFDAEVLGVLAILLVNCAVEEALSDHSLAVYVGHACGIGAEMGLRASKSLSAEFNW